jgi:hypothetical protein
MALLVRTINGNLWGEIDYVCYMTQLQDHSGWAEQNQENFTYVCIRPESLQNASQMRHTLSIRCKLCIEHRELFYSHFLNISTYTECLQVLYCGQVKV